MVKLMFSKQKVALIDINENFSENKTIDDQISVSSLINLLKSTQIALGGIEHGNK